jgi:hypothetical protein
MAHLSGKMGMREFKSAVESIQQGKFKKAEKVLLTNNGERSKKL